MFHKKLIIEEFLYSTIKCVYICVQAHTVEDCWIMEKKPHNKYFIDSVLLVKGTVFLATDRSGASPTDGQTQYKDMFEQWLSGKSNGTWGYELCIEVTHVCLWRERRRNIRVGCGIFLGRKVRSVPSAAECKFIYDLIFWNSWWYY